MSSLPKHRRCGCDCRDNNRFDYQAIPLNPLGCYACGGLKPPCKYIARFECQGFLNGQRIADADMSLRPLCAWENACEFVGGVTSRLYSNTFELSDPKSPNQDGCTWSQRYEGGFDWTKAANAVEWTLAIENDPVTFRHKSGLTFYLLDGVAWNCYNANTLEIRGEIPAGYANIPKKLCIVPAVTAQVPDWRCCAHGFRFTLEDLLSTASIIDQFCDLVAVGPNENILSMARRFVDQKGFTLTAATCGYVGRFIQHNMTDVPFVNRRVGQAFLAVATPMNDGLQSVAQLLIQFDDRGRERSCLYQCDSFQCASSTFYRVGPPTPLPETFNVVGNANQRSDWDGSGPCPRDWSNRTFSQGIQDGYDTEEHRFAACDPWCNCAPGAFRLIQFGSISECLSRTNSAGFCTGSYEGLETPVGPSRTMCCWGPSDIGHLNPFCATVYFNGDKWRVDWRYDGVFTETTDFIRVSCCPFKGYAPMPAVGDVTGCIAINMQPSCEDMSLCSHAAQLHVAIQNGDEFGGLDNNTLEQTGPDEWQVFEHVLGPDFVVTVTCTNGLYTCSYDDGSCVLAGTNGTLRVPMTLTTVSGTCSPSTMEVIITD